MSPACVKTKKTNLKYVVIVSAPKAPSTRRRHQRKLEKQKQKLQLCDFPADLVANIVEGLSSSDRIRFGTTCKNNFSLVTTTKNHRGSYQYQFREIDKLPWLATFTCHATARTNLSLDFSLFEPLHVQGQPDYATYNIKHPNGEGFGGWTKATLKASNKGWFLCVWPTQGKETGHLTSFLLFSPFNKRIIKLPDLKHRFENSWPDRVTCRATFSTDPSSPDCIYFFLSQDSIPGKFEISTLDQTSKQWNTKVFNNELCSVSSVVYNEGCFYCLSSLGQLAAYDVVHQSLELVIRWDSSPISYLRSVLSDDVRMYVVVREGKLIVAVMDNKPLNYKVEMNSCALFEFSFSTRTLVKITSLGNHALFLGQSSFSVHVSDPSSPINIAERAYFYSYNCGNGKCNLFYYSLKDGQCHAAKGSGYWSSDVQNGIWIEPPCLTSSPSGLLA